MGLLEELAVRCEARASRRLDALIACETDWPPLGPMVSHWVNEEALEPDQREGYVRLANHPDNPTSWAAPEFTSSLDAAMTLVPTELRLTFSEWDDEKHLRPRGPWQAILTKAGSGSSFNDMLGYRCDHAATPALAVCASALRARHALALKGSEG